MSAMTQPDHSEPSFGTTVPDFRADDGASDTLPSTVDLELDLDLDVDFATAALAAGAASTSPPVPLAPPVPQAFSAEAGQFQRGTGGFLIPDRRVLVVSADVDERVYLRARLALARLVWVDEAATTTQAEEAMKTQRHLMAIFNLDSTVVDGLALATLFRQTHPGAVCVVTGAAVPQAGFWGLTGRYGQWQRERDFKALGVEWLVKPLLPKKVAHLFARVHGEWIEKRVAE
jgi:hypothetical protein